MTAAVEISGGNINQNKNHKNPFQSQRQWDIEEIKFSRKCQQRELLEDVFHEALVIKVYWLPIFFSRHKKWQKEALNDFKSRI